MVYLNTRGKFFNLGGVMLFARMYGCTILFFLIIVCGESFGSKALGNELDSGRLDGKKIEAVEMYLNEDSNRINLGLGVFPFNPYYNGFSLSGSYTYLFNKTIGWEILHGDYVHSVQTGLTSELADEYGVNPEEIEKLEYTVSSNFVWVLSYGKLLLVDKYIRYFRLIGLLGYGLANTTITNYQTLNSGLHLSLHINDFWGLALEMRYRTSVVGGSETFPSFNLGFETSF
jgi:outer membrane beta-barrel protein